jgi:hypothetical protein
MMEKDLTPFSWPARQEPDQAQKVNHDVKPAQNWYNAGAILA